MTLDQTKPTLGRLARNATRSQAPHLWRGLVLGMPFVEGSGGPRDYSGFGNHGTLNNGPQWVNTPSGPGLALDGSNDYVSLSGNPVNGLSRFTVAGRVVANNLGDFPYICGVFDGGSGDRRSFYFFVRDDGTLDAVIGDGDESLAASNDGDQVTSGEAFDFAYTFDGENLTRYLNGTQTGSVDSSATFGSIAVGTRDLYIGNLNLEGSPQSGRYMDGEYYAIGIHSRDLAASEVKELHRDPFPAYRPGRTMISMFTAVGAAPGVSVPAAWHHLRNMHAA